jgi:DNA-binding IclR family transcriptional regulator
MDFQDQNMEKALTKNADKYFFISSLAKGMNILELLSDNEGLSVTQVAKIMNINRAPFLQEVASKFNETINLGFFNGNNVITIDKIDSTEILRMDAGIGGSEPAYCTSLGKAILAYLPDNKLEEYLKVIELKPYTPNTVTSKEKLKKELMHTRKNGYAIDNEQLSVGLRCVGAPVFDHSGQARYAISISGPSIRFGRKRLQEMQQALKEICQSLSEKLRSQSF